MADSIIPDVCVPQDLSRRSTLLGAAAVLAGAGPFIITRARAQQVIPVTFLASFPPGATFVAGFLNGYMPAVDAALAKDGKFKINWNLAHSGQIAKPRAELEAVQGGLGDIAVVPTPYFFDRLPMYEIPFMTPFTTMDAVYLSKVYKMLEDKFPQFHDVWAKYNQKMLATTANADAYVIISKKQIRTLDDMKGMKIGGVGSNLSWLQVVGATPVQASMADFYTGLNTGLYDGALTTPQSLGAFKLCQPARYLLDPGLGANGNVNLNVNLNFWNRLPAEVKQVLADAAPIFNTKQLEVLLAGSKDSLASCTSQFGMVTTKLPESERQKWAKMMPPLAQEWAARLEKNGMPGKAILKFYMDAMRDGKQAVARHWDRE